MIAENEYISLKGMSREQRDALRESFLWAYARNGKVAENARVFSIRLCTAQDRDELQAQMQEHMVANQRHPEKMQRLFHKESVKYASHMEN